MSYAQVAASGPQQTDEEHEDDNVSSTIDVDSPHISSVPSDYEEQSVKTDTQAERERLEAEAKDKADELKQKASIKKEQAKSQSKKIGQQVQANSDNPVFIGNAVTIVGLGGLLGYGAYRKHIAGELTWKVAGLWAGAVGLFGVADYFVSQYFFKKYPPKE